MLPSFVVSGGPKQAPKSIAQTDNEHLFCVMPSSPDEVGRLHANPIVGQIFWEQWRVQDRDDNSTRERVAGGLPIEAVVWQTLFFQSATLRTRWRFYRCERPREKMRNGATGGRCCDFSRTIFICPSKRTRARDPLHHYMKNQQIIGSSTIITPSSSGTLTPSIIIRINPRIVVDSFWIWGVKLQDILDRKYFLVALSRKIQLDGITTFDTAVVFRVFRVFGLPLP